MTTLPPDRAEIERRLAELRAEQQRLLDASRALQAGEIPPKAPTHTLRKRRLTDLSIKAIKRPESGRVQVPDSACPGLWLRCTDTGAKSWSFVYRTPGDARVKRYTLGPWPTISCSAARKKAKALASEVVNGKDPQAEKRASRHQNGDLVEQVAVEFIARVYRAKGLKSTPEAMAMIRNHVTPHWQGRRIGSITKPEIYKVLDHLSDQGFPRAANKVLQLVKQLFRWAKARGYVTTNPAEDVERPHQERSRARVLSDDELSSIWRAADRLDWPWREYIKMLVLLGQRRTEVASVKWADVDLSERVWRMPAEQTKMGRARVLPLPGAAVAMLEGMPRFAGSDYVFGRKLTSFHKMKTRLDQLSGVNDYVLHDLRRTFATGQQKIGTRLEVTEQLLGHTSGSRSGVVGIYQRHDFAAEQRVALEKWAEHVARLTGGEGAQVVNLR